MMFEKDKGLRNFRCVNSESDERFFKDNSSVRRDNGSFRLCISISYTIMYI